jgi:hypothetical protein
MAGPNIAALPKRGLAQPRIKRLLSSEHFSFDRTLIEAGLR